MGQEQLIAFIAGWIAMQVMELVKASKLPVWDGMDKTIQASVVILTALINFAAAAMLGKTEDANAALTIALNTAVSAFVAWLTWRVQKATKRPPEITLIQGEVIEGEAVRLD